MYDQNIPKSKALPSTHVCLPNVYFRVTAGALAERKCGTATELMTRANGSYTQNDFIIEIQNLVITIKYCVVSFLT